jgi:hypothetical protein
MPKNTLALLDEAINRESYEYLEATAPHILEALEEAVAKGNPPERIRRYVLAKIGPDRMPLALRLEQAARHLVREMER